jgi:hypothetical protein
VFRMGYRELEKIAEIYIFDCRRWFGRENHDQFTDNFSNLNVIQISNESDFESKLERLSPVATIDFIGKTDFSAEMRKIIKKTNSILVAVNRGTIPSPGVINRMRFHFIKRSRTIGNINLYPANSRDEKNNVIPKSSHLIIQMLKNKRNIFLLNFLNFKNKPHISVISGKKTLNSYYVPSKKILWVKSIDALEIYKLANQDSLLQDETDKEKYIAFIDDNLDDSLDWRLLSQSSPVDKIEHYKKLNRTFSMIESKEGMPIVIVAHPTRSKDSKLSENFNHRTIIFENTAKTIFQSEVVLNSTSGAVGFAVLAVKPITFLTTQKLDKSQMSLVSHEMKRQLGANMINMDRLNDSCYLTPKVNKNLYLKYIENYMDYKSVGGDDVWRALLEEIYKIRGILEE